MKIEINENVLKEFEYIIELHSKCDVPNRMESVEEMIGYVLASVADGSRRPGTWERSLLDSMGLITDCVEHDLYKNDYGAPKPPPYTEDNPPPEPVVCYCKRCGIGFYEANLTDDGFCTSCYRIMEEW